jgi:cell division protein FtsW
MNFIAEPIQGNFVDARIKVDLVLLGCAIALLSIGFVMIASASMQIGASWNDSPFYFILRHGIFLGLALIVAFAVFNVPMSWWERNGWLLLALALLLLIVVLVPGIGRTVNGSTRWISFGPLNLQPSEVAKVFMLAYVAGYLVRRLDEVRSSWWGFVKPIVVMVFAAFLLLMEPDFGAVVVMMVSVVGIIFLSGVRVLHFFVLIGACLSAVAVLAVSQPYRLKRLTAYTDPWADQFNSGYQLTQSLIAFGRGEWTGVGLGNSIQKLFYLPEAHTDFVFAIIGEEFGLIGTLAVIGLFGVLVIRAMMIGFRAEAKGHLFGAYMAYGLALLIGCQALINLGVNTGLLPTKGLTLPFVSYGGSSLIMSCIMAAILLRVDLEANLAPSMEGKT